MVKILSYDTREDELPYYEQFGPKIGIEYEYTNKSLTPETAKQAAGFDGVSVMSAGQDAYPAEVYAELQKAGIKYFSARTVGTDNIDIAAANAAGIKVARVPAYSPNAISELAITLALTLLRNTHRAYTRVKLNENFTIPSLVGRELGRQTVGIIGTGRIGRIVGEIAKGFGAEVLGYDIYRSDEATKFLTYTDTLDELLERSNVISLHMPLLPDTKGMIDAHAIEKLPQGAIVINTARGPLIDHTALVEGLESGKLGGAGLDVYDQESGIFGHDLDGQPIADPILKRLLQAPNVILTPHIAFYTDVAVEEMVRVSLQNLYDYNATGASANEVAA